MENIQNHDTSIFGMEIDEEGKSHLSAIAQWARLNAIAAFVALGISLLSTVMLFVNASRYFGSTTAGSGMFSMLISLVISLVLNITLITAATNIKKGVTQNDQGFFGIGLAKLATYFKITGILIIIGLAFFCIVLLFVMVAGLGSAGTGF